MNRSDVHVWSMPLKERENLALILNFKILKGSEILANFS